ncbi:MAG: hypothetical protein RJA99_4464 [Pseudomonadota bacterium]|jgi:hypothetical protein
MDRLSRATVAVAVALTALAGRVSAADEPPSAPVAATATDVGTEVVFRALSLLGVNYRFGGNTVDGGLDCSGLVRLVFHDTLGLPLPRRSEEISRVGGAVSSNELQPGDLVFFNTLRRAFSHVGIYIGNNQFVHAPSSGGTIRVESLGSDYWVRRFDGARRLLSSDLVASARATGAMSGDRLAISLPMLSGSVLADGGAPRDLLASLRAADSPARAATTADAASRGAAAPALEGVPAPAAFPVPAASATAPVATAQADATPRARSAPSPSVARTTTVPAAAARPTTRRPATKPQPVAIAARSTTGPSRQAGPRQRAPGLYVN